MFSALTSFLETTSQKAAEMVGEASKLEDGYDEGNAGEGDVIPIETLLTAPSEDVPSQFESSKAEWRVIIRGAIEDGNTFIIPVKRLLETEEVREKLEKAELLKFIDEAEVEKADAPDRFVKALLQEEGIDSIRFDVVPRYVSENNFWLNAYHRIHALRACTELKQTVELLTLLNTEPTEQSETRKKNVGSWDNGPHLAKLREALQAEGDRTRWLEEKRDAVTSELDSARSSCRLLGNLVSKSDAGELGESVLESCRYHKTKVTALLGELSSSTTDLTGTDLDVDSGELAKELVDINGALQRVIEDFVKLQEECSKEKRFEGSPAAGSSPIAAAASPLGERAENREAMIDDSQFNAELPWEDDE